MKISIRTQGNAIFLDICSNGKRKKRFIGLSLTGDKRLDKSILAKAEEIKAETYLSLISNPKQLLKPKADKLYLLKFISTLPHTPRYRSFNYQFKMFIYPKPDISISEIDKDFVLSFREYLINQDLKSSSKWSYFTILKSIIHKLIKLDYIEANPFRNVENIKYSIDKRVYLNLDDLHKLLNTSMENDCIKQASIFQCCTGLRISDIRQLRWDMLEGDRIKLIQKKTGKYLIIYLNNSALLILDNMDKTTDYIFNDLPKYDSNINTVLKRWALRAGLRKHLHTHIFRHTFAVLFLEAGGDLYALSKMLGHSDIKHTQVYSNISNERLKESFNRLPDFQKWD